MTNGQFKRDKFLSEEIDYFAEKVYYNSKLIVIQYANSIEKYQYQGKWFLQSKLPNNQHKQQLLTKDTKHSENFYMLNIVAVKNEKQAVQMVNELKAKGENSNYLWIPDYASLSGAKFFSVYIGPFYAIEECEIATENYKKIDKNVHGLYVSQEKKRIQINGISKVVVSNN